MLGFIRRWRTRRAFRAERDRSHEMAQFWLQEARLEDDPWRKRSHWRRALYYFRRAKQISAGL